MRWTGKSEEHISFSNTPEESALNVVRPYHDVSVELRSLPKWGKVELIIKDVETRQYSGANPQQHRSHSRLIRWELDLETAELLARLISTTVDKTEAAK